MCKRIAVLVLTFLIAICSVPEIYVEAEETINNDVSSGNATSNVSLENDVSSGNSGVEVQNISIYSLDIKVNTISTVIKVTDTTTNTEIQGTYDESIPQMSYQMQEGHNYQIYVEPDDKYRWNAYPGDIFVEEKNGWPWSSYYTYVGNIYSVSENQTFTIALNEQFDVNIKTSGNGTVTWEDYSTDVVRVDAGTDVALVLQPQDGYYVSEVKVDGNSVTPDDANVIDGKDGSYTYTFQSILRDSSIEVFFTEIKEIFASEDMFQLVFSQEKDMLSRSEKDNKTTYILTTEQSVSISFDEYTVVREQNGSGVISEDATTVTYGTSTVDGVEVVLRSTENDSFYHSMVKCKLNLKFIADNVAPELTIDGEKTIWLSGQEENITITGTVEDNGESGIDRIVWFTEEKNIDTDASEILSTEENIVVIENGNFLIEVADVPQENVTYYLYAIDNASNIMKEVKCYQMDTGAPVVSVNVDGITGEAVTKNEYVTVTVNALDTQAGVEEIVLYLNGEVVAKEQNNGALVFSVKLEKNTDNSITASAVDKVGNASEQVTYEGGTSGLIFDSECPVIAITPDGEAIKSAYSEIICCLDNAILNVSLKEATSGIATIAVEMNGQSITEDAEGNALILDYSDLEEWVKEYEFAISTNQIEEAEDNIYNIKITVEDCAGNVQVYSQIVYVDKVAPVIETITTDIEADIATSVGGSGAYAYFSDGEVTVHVQASDGEAGVGVGYIEYYIVYPGGGKSELKRVEVSEEDTIQIKLGPDFKGYLYIRAVDLLGNVSETYGAAYGYILESAAMHEREEHVEIIAAATTFQDNNQNALYADNTEVAITAMDSYSGIATVEWRIEAEQDTGNNAGGIVEIDGYGNVSDAQWSVGATDKNLVTKLTCSIPVASNSNDITVYVKITDRAGHISEDTIVISIDKTAPTIEVQFDNWDADEIYTDTFDKDRVATITVTERNFAAERVEVFLTNTDGTVPEISEWKETRDEANPDNNTYTATLLFRNDGDYALSISVTDLAGNTSALVEEQLFTIDKTAPEVEVSFDNVNSTNGNYYNSERVATIKVTEHNFDPERVVIVGTVDVADETITFPVESAWIHTSGDVYVATLTFDRDAEYAFTVSSSDKAGNVSNVYEESTYIIDRTVPEIVISGVEDLSANNGAVVPVVRFSDANYDRNNVHIELTGANSGSTKIQGEYTDSENGQTFTFEDFVAEKSVDDIYTLTATSTDLAGNVTSETVVFSVNRFGSIYVLDNSVKQIAGTYVTEPIEVKITEINADALVKDTIKVVLIYNGTPTTLIAGSDYTITETGGEGSWSQYEYAMDKELFAKDGVYIVTLYSEDVAGNINENINEAKEAEITFGIDTTNPVIIPLNLAEGETYNTDNYVANIAVNDNLVLSEVNIWVNGEAVSYENIGDGYTFSIPESAKKQNIVISAKDAAGNRVVCEVDNLLVSTNIFVRWLNNKTAVVVTVAGGCVCIGGFGLVFGLKRRGIVRVKRKS